MEKDILAYWLKANLDNMKSQLGRSCTYLAFETENKQVYLKANLINELGGKDKIKQKINVSLENLNEEDFKNMFNVLKDRVYAS